jgi:hypothetical protein
MIFVLLAVAWAVYLIPKALRRSDEAVRTRSIDRFSPATRVLARREPVAGRDARLVVTPPRATRRNGAAAAWTSTGSDTGSGSGSGTGAVAAEVVEPAVQPGTPVGPAPGGAARRTAARVAARRRRRILALLVLCVAGTAAAAQTGRGPWWWVAVPAVATVGFLVLCRLLVRRDAAPRPVATPTRRSPVEEGVSEPVPATQPDLSDEQDERARADADAAVMAVAVGADRVADFDDAEDTMGLSAAELRAAAGGTTPAPGGSLWDPLPMTLPTYVTKPKARRTVRTIDLGEPGTWTSGRTAHDAELAAASEQGDAPAAAATAGTGSGQQAVGS